jgi:phosphatidylglycerophosphate synthase
MTNNPINAGEPADDARRNARSAVAPWRLEAATIAVTAALIALFYGQPPKIWTAAVFVGAAIVTLVAVFRWQRRHGGRPDRRWNELSSASRATIIVQVVVLVGSASVLRVVLPPGTALSYGAQFLCAATVLGVGAMIRRYLNARPSSEPS